MLSAQVVPVDGSMFINKAEMPRVGQLILTVIPYIDVYRPLLS